MQLAHKASVSLHQRVDAAELPLVSGDLTGSWARRAWLHPLSLPQGGEPIWSNPGALLFQPNSSYFEAWRGRLSVHTTGIILELDVSSLCHTGIR